MTRHAILVGLLLLAGSPSAWACAACFGKSDSPMAQGMNAGIFTLLLCIMSVLVAISVFFFYIIRRAARMSAVSPAPEATPSLSQPTSR